MHGDIEVSGEDLPRRTIVQLNQMAVETGFSLGRLLFKPFQMHQTGHNQSFLVGLTFGELPVDVLAKGLASLNKLATIAILELLEHAHGSLNSGRRDDFFHWIGHGRNNFEILVRATLRELLATVSAKADRSPLTLFFVAAASAAPVERRGCPDR